MSLPPIVFAGPSVAGLPLESVVRLPPASAGDMLALADGQPRVVALIDGVFDAQAAVQHKEILELMARGFRVLGSSSMGALRAAELHHFGMEGVGAVFTAYRSGRITADDEVALLHAPGELEYRALTEPLVDMRATLAASVRAAILSAPAARIIREHARGCFWRERTWTAILRDCRRSVDGADFERFAGWLPSGRVPIKALDAQSCLKACLDPWRSTSRTPPPRTFFFQALARQRGVKLHPPIRSSPST
ncbi:hypothetical protein IFT54_12235 [Sphingomonas sp. CFBP 13714]|uniref:TfuA-like protein n=1 Tax=Sphingomonas sp. CFBP 13714 TaxID=2775308 RepID=UPI00178770C3|nr:TfuA-like protein [Sphingomonas sp. CFBP 13714]MBD8700589.1 hypothetical protein [Sphingomonas sp. CFBP 13714]